MPRDPSEVEMVVDSEEVGALAAWVTLCKELKTLCRRSNQLRIQFSYVTINHNLLGK